MSNQEASSSASKAALSASQASTELWQTAGLPAQALARLALTGQSQGFVSSFGAVQAVQASVGVAALAATEIARWRQPQQPAQTVQVDAQHAAFESSGYFTLNGQQPDQWAPISGLYACGQAVGAPGWVRIHANFDHHRDGALALLGLPVGAQTLRSAVEQALAHWRAEDFELQAAERNLPIVASRSYADWQALGQEAVVAASPLVQIERIGDAPPLAWPELHAGQRPLAGLKVLDLTRILAGPVAGRTLAAYGADVMLINGPHLPNIDAIADTSRGKRSAQLDLRNSADQQSLAQLLSQAHVFQQAYRPGALAAKGLGAEELARLRPGIVVAELCAMAGKGLGPGAVALIRWCRPPVASMWMKLQPVGSASHKSCPCRRWTMVLAFCWPLARKRLCCARPERAAAGACVSHWLAWRAGCAVWGGWRCQPKNGMRRGQISAHTWKRWIAALASCKLCAIAPSSRIHLWPGIMDRCHRERMRRAGERR